MQLGLKSLSSALDTEPISYISDGTRRNWKKLQVVPENKLKARANKTQSLKRFIPQERCQRSETNAWIDSFINKVMVNNWNVESVLKSIIENLFDKKGIKQKASYSSFSNAYKDIPILEDILNINVPNDFDILGTIYQSLLTEGIKNQLGSYYTPKSVIQDMIGDLTVDNNQSYLDPCCGSGAFLLIIDCDNPNSLYGIDVDPIAVMLAKANLMLKYHDSDFVPNIFQMDFLSNDIWTENNLNKLGHFDFIATNPPWGGVTDPIEEPSLTSKETSSYFFVKSSRLLKKNGRMDFLMPTSILNVKQHKDVRKYILENGNLQQISIYEDSFTGVSTSYANIRFSNNEAIPIISYKYKGNIYPVDRSSFFQTDGYIFNLIRLNDSNILKKIKSKGTLSLRNSSWALGIVTGDNKNKIHKIRGTAEEPVYTGKDICAFNLKPASNFLLFDRKNLQQVAKDEFYRAPEKLVYKFIGKKLTFAYDNTGALFLNSANILIPRIDGMSIKTTLAFLNSSIYQYLYISMFNEVKILKGNLIELPFPSLKQEDDEYLSSLVDLILSGNHSAQQRIEIWMNQFYELTKDEQSHIDGVLNGTID